MRNIFNIQINLNQSHIFIYYAELIYTRFQSVVIQRWQKLKIEKPFKYLHQQIAVVKLFKSMRASMPFSISFIILTQAIEKKWKIILIIVTFISVFFSKYLYYFQTDEKLKEVRKGCVWDLVFQGGAAAIIFTILDHGSHKLLDDWVFKHFIDQKKYQQTQARKIRSYSISKWIFSSLYYAPVAFWAYYLLKQTSFLPSWLGGNGSCRNLHIYVQNFDEASSEMKLFYLIQFGKHLSRLCSHLFIRSQGVYYETALHHGLSTFLILYSYLSNMWVVGVMVLFNHDLSDFMFFICRGYRDYKFKNDKLSLFLELIAFPFWIVGRILLTSYCCIYSSVQFTINLHNSELLGQQLSSVLYWPLVFMSFMLFCLQILQLFWTYYITIAFVKKSFKKNKLA